MKHILLRLSLKHLLCTAASVFAFIPAKTQNTDSLFSEQETNALIDEYLSYDSMLIEEMMQDTSSFLFLLDTTYNSANDGIHSSLMIRTGYTSNVVNAGRDFGLEQYGLSAGISYYHKNGLFADVYSYWNSEYDPSFNSITASAGYNYYLKKWSFSGSYDHTFYNNNFMDGIELTYPFTNSLNASAFIDIWEISLGLDYSFLFGDETAHRLRPTIMGSYYLYKSKSTRIKISPYISALIGDASIVYSEQRYTYRQLIRQIGLRRFLLYYQNNPNYLEDILYSETSKYAIGVMNYSITVPLNFYYKSWAASLSYTFNLPVELPGETIDTSSNGYLGASIYYMISFK